MQRSILHAVIFIASKHCNFSKVSLLVKFWCKKLISQSNTLGRPFANHSANKEAWLKIKVVFILFYFILLLFFRMCFYNSTTSQPELFYYKDVLTTGLIFYKQLPLLLRSIQHIYIKCCCLYFLISWYCNHYQCNVTSGFLSPHN